MLMASARHVPEESIEVVPLGDRFVLRSHVTGAVVLSDQAGFAALAHAEGGSRDDAVQRIARSHGLSRYEAERVLDATLAAWDGAGLLSNVPLGFPRTLFEPRPGPALSLDLGRNERSMRLISDEPGLIERAASAFAPHVLVNGGRPCEVMDIRSGEDGYTVFRDGSAVWGTADADALRFYVFQDVIAFLSERDSVGAIVHGAIVSDASGSLALAGPSGQGKTTLALDLSRRGWRVASDDLFALHTDARHAISVPTRAHVKRAGKAPATEWRERYESPPKSTRSGELLPVSALVFPAYRPGTAAEVAALTPEEALVRLLRSGTEVARPNGSIAPLVAFVAATPAWSVTYGATEDAVRFCHDVRDSTHV